MTTNSVEERILERARDKLNVDKKVIQAGKFNQKSSEQEAKAFLASIIDEEQDDDEPDDSAMDPEQINHMLARSEEELELFQVSRAWYSKARQTKQRLWAKGL